MKPIPHTRAKPRRFTVVYWTIAVALIGAGLVTVSGIFGSSTQFAGGIVFSMTVVLIVARSIRDRHSSRRSRGEDV